MGNCGVCRICLPLFPSSAFRASTDRVCTNPPSSFLAPGIPAIIHGLFPPNAIWQSEVGAPKKGGQKGGGKVSLSLHFRVQSRPFAPQKKEENTIYGGHFYILEQETRSFLYLGNDILSGPKHLQIWLGCTKGGGGFNFAWLN